MGRWGILVYSMYFVFSSYFIETSSKITGMGRGGGGGADIGFINLFLHLHNGGWGGGGDTLASVCILCCILS